MVKNISEGISPSVHTAFPSTLKKPSNLSRIEKIALVVMAGVSAIMGAATIASANSFGLFKTSSNQVDEQLLSSKIIVEIKTTEKIQPQAQTPQSLKEKIITYVVSNVESAIEKASRYPLVTAAVATIVSSLSVYGLSRYISSPSVTSQNLVKPLVPNIAIPSSKAESVISSVKNGNTWMSHLTPGTEILGQKTDLPSSIPQNFSAAALPVISSSFKPQVQQPLVRQKIISDMLILKNLAHVELTSDQKIYQSQDRAFGLCEVAAKALVKDIRQVSSNVKADINPKVENALKYAEQNGKSALGFAEQTGRNVRGFVNHGLTKVSSFVREPSQILPKKISVKELIEKYPSAPYQLIVGLATVGSAFIRSGNAIAAANAQAAAIANANANIAFIAQAADAAQAAADLAAANLIG